MNWRLGVLHGSSCRRKKGNFQMKKARTEYLLAEAIDLIDTLFHKDTEDLDVYKSTYEFIKENLDIDDSELEEIHVDVEFLKNLR